MNTRKSLCRAVVSVAMVLIGSSIGLRAQNSAARSRVVEAVDDTKTVQLAGNVHPLARRASDQGALADSQPMTHMLLLLQRAPEQELALRQLLDAQVTKASESYHAWLTPVQFGKQFGPSDADVQVVTDWLTRQGFRVNKVAAGKTVVEFDGNVGQVRNAFHTEIHRFVLNGEEGFANVSDPSIPEALSPVVAGVAALHNFPKRSYVRTNGPYRKDRATGRIEPLFTTTAQPTTYAVGPGDWTTIYHAPTAATGGAGQTIAIVADSNINTSDVVNFRSIFGLPAYSKVCPNDTFPTTCPLSVIVNGPDPGLNSDEVEADLDAQWTGAIAPAAQIIVVVTEGTMSNPGQVSDGIDLSALYIVDNNIASIMNESFGSCEPFLGNSGNAFYSALWEQASAQGITVVVASGDNGAAACDPVFATVSSEPAATLGLAVNGIASTPFNVAVGGTDFDPTTTNASAATYWNQTAGTVNSALSYIPEIAWNDSACAFTPSLACTTVDTTGSQLDLAAGGGGPSNCSNQNAAGTTCLSGYAKPPWQNGITTNDTVRDLPDVSFFSSNGGPADAGTGNFSGASLVICESDALPAGVISCDLKSPYMNFVELGGTSAATPAFAAVMALVDQSQVSASNPLGRQGNANYVLYGLAAQDATNYKAGKCASSVAQTPAAACVYNDVTKGNNAVACLQGSKSVVNNLTSWCAGSGSIYGLTATSAGTAYLAGGEYDLATGLGSINVGNLLSNWGTVVRTATTTTLSGATGGSPTGNTFNAAVSVTSAMGTPAGDVSLIALASDKTTVLGSFGPFALTGGSATVTTTLLPVGAAWVEATYSGDAAHAVSTSTPVALSPTVAGAGYTAQTSVNFVGFTTTPPTVTQSAQNFQYGTAYILQIVVARSSDGKSCAYSQPNTKPPFPCPTGTITLTDNGSPLKDFLQNGTLTNVANLNNLGIAEDQPIDLSATVNTATPGVHNIQATYSGDNNYAAGAPSNTLKITIQKAVPTGIAVGSSLTTIMPGTPVTLTAYVVTNATAAGQGPTGSIQFSNGTTSLGTANCVPTNSAQNVNPPIVAIPAGAAYCFATLTTSSISGLSPAPGGPPATLRTPRLPLLVALVSLLVFALGMRWISPPRRRAYALAGIVAIALLVGGVAGCGGGGGGGNGGTIRNITATYAGDSNYAAAPSGSVPITVQ